MGVVVNTSCPACGGNHQLLLEYCDSNQPAQGYEFDCAVAGKSIHLAELPNDWWKTVDDPPEDAILLRPIV